MAGKRGKLLLLKMAATYNGTSYTTVAELKATSISVDKTSIDVTSKDSDDWREAITGTKSVKITADGNHTGDATHDVLWDAANAGTPWATQLVDASGNTYTGNFIYENFTLSGSDEGLESFSVSLTSTGEIVKA
ncbi:putative Phage tail protein [Candidatus Defluviicoccus seviourii]|uniref:Phage tail protein n=1 Tax=Candidatus Defluviicoccus seviourii TaxID=2565273 RepID=A0A564WH55_9PROT|nr:putative Phage tail protein [Candidatus Defluviicoccus seviourii]